MKRASVLLVAVALAGPASADPAPGGKRAPASAEASGKAHFQRGQKLSAAGDYEAAYREFAAGYALTERPLFLFNMAEAARAAGDPVRARDNYQAFLQADPDNQLAATARARLAELAPPPPPVKPPPPVPLAPPSSVEPADAAAGPPPPLTAPAHAEARPIYKKWPFWAVVAGGVVAGGVVVYAATRDRSPCTGGCMELSFR
jgi:tetratricopeptide (TPR) repeat protein